MVGWPQCWQGYVDVFCWQENAAGRTGLQRSPSWWLREGWLGLEHVPDTR
jgi:hypothetical protein